MTPNFANASGASSANLMPREHFHSGILSQLDFTMILQSLSIKLVLLVTQDDTNFSSASAANSANLTCPDCILSYPSFAVIP